MRETLIRNLSDLDGLAREFVDAFPKGAVAGLSGELGVGKTALVRAVVRLLCARGGIDCPRVTSPTFVMHQSYPKVGVEHFDLYRLEDATEESLLHLGYGEAAERARLTGGYLFVEWPERARSPTLLGLTASIDLQFAGLERLCRWEGQSLP